jgi:ribosomal-protein-alanine N-acetyltransferase
MLTKRKVVIRPACQNDSREIRHLVQFGAYVHQHLDWCKPTDWIGHRPYLVAEWNYQLLAAFACPPDLEGIAWLRLFAVDSKISLQDAWSELWSGVQEQLSAMRAKAVVIPYHPWFQEVITNSQFEHFEDVVMMQWNRAWSPVFRTSDLFQIRSMKLGDIPDVYRVDNQAFEPIWQNSQSLLEIAFSKSAFATVAEKSGTIVGYQMSTANRSNGHLARLAVLPEWHGYGIGTALIKDLLNQFHLWGTLRVTVNTQKGNIASLALYEKVGFQKTNETYPVYQSIP